MENKETETTFIADEVRRLKAFREAEGLSQSDFAKALKLTQPNLAMLESGSRKIKVDLVKQLHEKFSMSYEWFYHGKGHRLYKPEKSTLLKDIKSMEASMMMLEQKYRQLDESMRKIYRDFYAKGGS